jgi:hypothetical protein
LSHSHSYEGSNVVKIEKIKGNQRASRNKPCRNGSRQRIPVPWQIWDVAVATPRFWVSAGHGEIYSGVSYLKKLRAVVSGRTLGRWRATLAVEEPGSGGDGELLDSDTGGRGAGDWSGGS